MSTVFLTGGTGFVGSHAAERFLARGWAVKALVRDAGRRGRLPAGVEAIVGRLDRPASYRDAMEGCDAVVHAAGAITALNLEGYRQVNALGSAAVAKAASEACPEAMFVLVSSQAAAGPARAGRPVAETDPPRPASWYGQSKLEGERAVAEHFRGAWCAIRPCVVYGPGDRGLLDLFLVVQKGFAPVIAGGNGRLQLISADALAQVLVEAAGRRDLAGRTAFAAADAVTMREMILAIAALRRRRPWVVPVPALAVWAAGMIESTRQWITRSPRPFNLDKARDGLQRDWLCDAQPLLLDLARGNGDKPGELSDVRIFSELAIPSADRWRQGLREVCRCYVVEQWLRQNEWAV